MSGISIPGGLEFLFAHPEFQKFMKSERGREALATTWAERPSAAEHPWRLFFITDIGVGGSIWISNGYELTPIAPITLAQNFETVSKSDADTTEFTAFTTVIPGGLMGLNRTLEVFPAVSYPSSATAKVIRCRFGSFEAYNKSRTTVTLDVPKIEIINRNDPAKQVYPFHGSANYGSGFTASMATSTVDTSVDQPLSLTLQWGTAGAGSNNISLSAVRVRLIP